MDRIFITTFAIFTLIVALAFFVLLASPAAFALPVKAEANNEVELIRGLDGGDYMPYREEVIVKAQEALRDQGFYEGEINGMLDEATMKAIGEFQKEHGLMVNGVPSPRT